MQLMADGLAGHEMDFFPVVQDNRWIGGSTDYSDLNEGLPYWFNGLVPLAYGLNDTTLISQVQKVADYVLDHQDDKGWLGPETTYNSATLWGRFPMVLGFIQMAEADPSYTDKIVTALQKFTSLMDGMLTDGQSADEEWGRARYADMTRVLQWLYENHAGDNPSGYIGTMQKLQTWGLDWTNFYTQSQYPFADLNTIPDASLPFYGYIHAVNVAQGLKTMATNWRFASDDSLLDSQRTAVNWTMLYHGSPSGSVLGDERMAGLGPQHGSETCTTVETMQTLTYLYQVMGDASFSDRAELAAYNALPAALTPDAWAHNYISLPNEPWASEAPEHDGLWYNVGTDGVKFATEPNYPCCAVNHPQGWPKLSSAVFSRAENNLGLAHTVLAPGSVTYTIADSNTVSIECDTAYPFSPDLSYKISADAPFTFYVRVPTWQTDAPKMVLNGAAVDNTTPDEHGVVWIDVPKGDSTLAYTLTPEVRVESRANDSVAIHHGALLYAVDLGQTSNTGAPDVDGAPAQADSVFYNNTMPWNLAIDTGSLKYTGPGSGDAVNVSGKVWDYQALPNTITADACEIGWPISHGVSTLRLWDRDCADLTAVSGAGTA